MKLPHETSLILYDVLLGSDVLMILLCIHTLICSWRISKGWNKKKLFFFLMILVFTSRATQNIMDTIVLAGGSYNPETQVPSLIMAVISENCFFAAQVFSFRDVFFLSVGALAVLDNDHLDAPFASSRVRPQQT